MWCCLQHLSVDADTCASCTFKGNKCCLSSSFPCVLLLRLFIYIGMPEHYSGTLMQQRLLTSCQNSSFLAPSHEILFGILCIVTLSHPNSDHHLSVLLRILLPSLQLICCLDIPLETLFMFCFFPPHSNSAFLGQNIPFALAKSCNKDTDNPYSSLRARKQRSLGNLNRCLSFPTCSPSSVS